jgi:hypothetical protein
LGLAPAKFLKESIVFKRPIKLGKWSLFFYNYWCFEKQQQFGGGVIYRIGPVRLTKDYP